MFRTELTITPQERLLPRTARVLTVGSCFADSIGEQLRLNKVQTLANPFGTVFQPLALAQLLRAAAGEEQDWQQHLVEARGRWQSYDFHSTIGAESPVELLQTIQETIRRVGEFVRTADTVVLTLGTAWAYRLRETGELVSNLHKLPASLFDRELLTADEIVNALAEVHALLRRANPDIRIVLTVSPVRHIKDTLPLNAVSKSVLRVACHYLSELLPNVSYFPAYELLTDDLRDYRFYAADMLHLSDVAEEYIWERFARAYFDADFGRFRKEWAAVRQALGHRPLHPGAPEHRIFLDQTRERLERLTSQGIDVRQELRDVQRQLAALPPPRPTRASEEAPEDDEERIDIGEAAATPVGTAASTTTEETRHTERRQNNRRDGRQPDRSGRERRHNQSLPALLPTAEVVAPAPVENAPEELGVASVETLLSGLETKPLTLEEGENYPAKKKKRRSRGGAKRTARQNATRLVAEQNDTELTPETELESAENHLTETVGSSSEESVDGLVGSADYLESESVASTPTNTALTSAQPARKRGTGPTPKKSKVITKSGVVKRGQHNNLYRTAAPEASEVAIPALAAAPIVSPPVIPEIMPERPAATLETISQPEVNELILLAAEPTPPTPPRTKRGRPKAADALTTASVIEADSATAEPMAAATSENLAPATPSKKKSASRTTKVAKPKPKAKAPKQAAKPTTSTRRRPPGKTDAPPAGDSPAT